MNVKELRGKLDAIPDDYDVYLEDWVDRFEAPLKLEKVQIYVNDSEHEVTLGVES